MISSILLFVNATVNVNYLIKTLIYRVIVMSSFFYLTQELLIIWRQYLSGSEVSWLCSTLLRCSSTFVRLHCGRSHNVSRGRFLLSSFSNFRNAASVCIWSCLSDVCESTSCCTLYTIDDTVVSASTRFPTRTYKAVGGIGALLLKGSFLWRSLTIFVPLFSTILILTSLYFSSCYILRFNSELAGGNWNE